MKGEQMISVVDNKDFILTKIVDIIKSNPKISQKEVISSVTTIFDTISEEDKTIILQLLNTLVQNKVIKRVNIGRKVTYSFNDFTNDSDEKSLKNDSDKKVDTKKLKRDISEFILNNLKSGSVAKDSLTDITLEKFGINEVEKLDTSTDSKYTLYKGLIGSTLSEFNKNKIVNITGNKNNLVVSLVKLEKEGKKEKKENKKIETKKEVKANNKKSKFKDVMERYDITISNTLEDMKKEQKKIQKEYNERQKENILRFICNSK